MKILSKDEVNAIVRLSAAKGNKFFVLLNVLARTGMRVSEAINMRPQDLLIDEHQIIVRGKGNKIRNIDIPAELGFLIKIYLDRSGIKNGERIFPITRNTVYKITKRIGGVNPHVFRHSYAVELLRKTKNIRYVQTQLGHTSLRTTEIYLRYMEFDKEKEVLEGLYK